MSESNEEKLANFQSITAIDDVGEAIGYLEAHNWDLLAAVNSVLGAQEPDVQITTPRDITGLGSVLDPEAATADVLMTAPSSPIRNNHQSSIPVVSSGFGSAFAPFDSGASTSRFNGESSTFGLNDEVIFNVHFDGRIFKIPIKTNLTVGELKQKVQEQTNIRVCRQALKGWKETKQREAQSNSTVLRQLNLDRQNDLYLTDMTREGYLGDNNAAVALSTNGENNIASGLSNNPLMNETYTLRITVRPTGELKVLKFPGHNTVLSVKTDVYTVTDIPVRHQRWTGWPANIQNTMTLADTGIQLDHNFTLENAKENRNNANDSGSSNANLDPIEIDSENEEFEDAEGFDDDIFTDTPAPIRNRIKHLIPDPVDDESVGCIQFIQNYEERYGNQHPIFFQGSLGDAVKEACQKPARERKMLAIYLHHDGSVLTNVFCGQLLGHETIVNMFLENFVVYGWDLTIESNKNLFLTSISVAVGPSAAVTVRSIPTEHMPTILLVARIRSQCEIFSVIHGNIGLDDLYSSLMESREMYNEQLTVEIREEEERYARERVKMEQDEAYQESLLADRAKEEAKRQKELMMATERQRLESEKAELDAIKESVRFEAEQALPAEPELEKGPDIAKIRIRLPSGEFIERRFYTSNTLNGLFNFITSKGFPISEYKLIASFPRRDLTSFNPDDTFHQHKLFPQETIILEER